MIGPVLAKCVEMARPIVHSGPTLQWWLSMDASQQGAWFSGLMSFAAVFSVFVLAAKADRDKKMERLDLGRTFAPAVARELRIIRYSCVQVHDCYASRVSRIQKARFMYEKLAEIDSSALNLVAERDIYRGVTGASLMALHGALLRLSVDRRQWTMPDDQSSEAFLIFSSAHMAGAASLIGELSSKALEFIWRLTPEHDQAIPDVYDPYASS